MEQGQPIRAFWYDGVTARRHVGTVRWHCDDLRDDLRLHSDDGETMIVPLADLVFVERHRGPL